MVRDGLALTYNGELFNYPDLRRELAAAGVVFRGRSDTEVVLEAWRCWGVDCLPRMRGMFAFAVFDERTQELVLARDPLGIKPLFYLARGHGLLFASELKAIVAATGTTLWIDAGAVVASLLYYWVPDTRCAFADVHKLPPGTWLRMRPDGGIIRGAYWSLRDEAQAASEMPAPDLSSVITDSLRRHLISDVGVGIFLSGGLDSSYLTALAAQENTDLTAYTIAFRAEDSRWEAMPDDLRYARVVAGQFGLRGQLVQRVPTEEPADPRHPGIVRQLEHRPGAKT